MALPRSQSKCCLSMVFFQLHVCPSRYEQVDNIKVSTVCSVGQQSSPTGVKLVHRCPVGLLYNTRCIVVLIVYMSSSFDQKLQDLLFFWYGGVSVMFLVQTAWYSSLTVSGLQVARITFKMGWTLANCFLTNKPQVEAIEGAGDVTDLAKHDEVLHHAVQHALQVEEAATAFDVELVEHLGCLLGQVLPQGLLLVQPMEDVLLHILDDYVSVNVHIYHPPFTSSLWLHDPHYQFPLPCRRSRGHYRRRMQSESVNKPAVDKRLFDSCRDPGSKKHERQPPKQKYVDESPLQRTSVPCVRFTLRTKGLLSEVEEELSDGLVLSPGGADEQQPGRQELEMTGQELCDGPGGAHGDFCSPSPS
ncbi:hypothetical protein F7725_010561 [Dissostichus mawsoni]|uniref:Uncharacterized protein n=1 Tax=Dissostichus mawsoni TaxID=36200 RepID=A0A7J5XPL5_DISMA|nr:hypothetical protein F7725_010561 [Dissostichus mawsoni]